MFFVRQQTNQCGLHAIQNLFKSAAVSKADIHNSCQTIHEKTGDSILNHESLGGDWSVEAVVETVRQRGYKVKRAVKSIDQRQWSGDDIDNLMKKPSFRGFIIHQPVNRHFTCIRPEVVDGEKQLFYVDSQSSGPIRISPRLASRRCLASAYAWEPFLVEGDEMEYVAPVETPVSTYSDIAESKNPDKFKPSAEFLREWDNLSKTNNTETT